MQLDIPCNSVEGRKLCCRSLVTGKFIMSTKRCKDFYKAIILSFCFVRPSFFQIWGILEGAIQTTATKAFKTRLKLFMMRGGSLWAWC